jgi:hypothetical protein
MVFATIDQMIADARIFINQHPLVTGEWTEAQRYRFSIYVVGLAALWPTHIACAAAAVNNRKLREALYLNALCEIGAGPDQVGHVTLARQFCSSQGFTAREMSSWVSWHETATNIAFMSALADEREEFIAGFMYFSEEISSLLYDVFQPPFRAVGADMTYMMTHVEVDGDDHSRMLREAIVDILATGGDVTEVERGVKTAVEFEVVQYLAFIERAGADSFNQE